MGNVFENLATHICWKMALPGLLNHNMDLKKCKKLPYCDNPILKFLQCEYRVHNNN